MTGPVTITEDNCIKSSTHSKYAILNNLNTTIKCCCFFLCEVHISKRGDLIIYRQTDINYLLFDFYIHTVVHCHC